MSPDSTCTRSSFALTKVVGRSAPFTRPTELTVNALPVTVTTKDELNAFTDVGEIAVATGAGLSTAKTTAADAPPSASGVYTVTSRLTAMAKSLAAISAVSFVALTNVVGRSKPFHRTMDVGAKFCPVTVSVIAGLPTAALVGAIDASDGGGYWTTKVRASDVPPPGPGETTVTLAGPADARSADEMSAVSWVVLTKLVGRSTPFHRTTDARTKSLPCAWRCNEPLPTRTAAGEIDASEGVGFGSEFGVGSVGPSPPHDTPATAMVARHAARRARR